MIYVTFVVGMFYRFHSPVFIVWPNYYHLKKRLYPEIWIWICLDEKTARPLPISRPIFIIWRSVILLHSKSIRVLLPFVQTNTKLLQNPRNGQKITENDCMERTIKWADAVVSSCKMKYSLDGWGNNQSMLVKSRCPNRNGCVEVLLSSCYFSVYCCWWIQACCYVVTSLTH